MEEMPLKIKDAQYSGGYSLLSRRTRTITHRAALQGSELIHVLSQSSYLTPIENVWLKSCHSDSLHPI